MCILILARIFVVYQAEAILYKMSLGNNNCYAKKLMNEQTKKQEEIL